MVVFTFIRVVHAGVLQQPGLHQLQSRNVLRIAQRIGDVAAAVGLGEVTTLRLEDGVGHTTTDIDAGETPLVVGGHAALTINIFGSRFGQFAHRVKRPSAIGNHLIQLGIAGTDLFQQRFVKVDNVGVRTGAIQRGVSNEVLAIQLRLTVRSLIPIAFGQIQMLDRIQILNRFRSDQRFLLPQGGDHQIRKLGTRLVCFDALLSQTRRVVGREFELAVQVFLNRLQLFVDLAIPFALCIGFFSPVAGAHAGHVDGCTFQVGRQAFQNDVRVVILALGFTALGFRRFGLARFGRFGFRGLRFAVLRFAGIVLLLVARGRRRGSRLVGRIRLVGVAAATRSNGHHHAQRHGKSRTFQDVLFHGLGPPSLTVKNSTHRRQNAFDKQQTSKHPQWQPPHFVLFHLSRAAVLRLSPIFRRLAKNQGTIHQLLCCFFAVLLYNELTIKSRWFLNF